MPVLAAASFAAVDWAVLGAYLALVVAVGIAAGRRQGGADEFFLASRSMPVWAVAISVLATGQSAATFVGGPQQAYDGDLTYLSANLGVLLAVGVAAAFFIPAFYRHGVTSIYELLGHELGSPAQRAASAAFMAGRVFASGARLYITAIPFSLIAFGSLEPRPMLLSILLITATAAAYTLAGGIRAVIWTDVIQAAVYIGTVVVALVVLWREVGLSAGQLIERLEPAGKLTVIDAGWSWTSPYGLWVVLFGVSLLNLAAFGTDQDLTQRLLTCRSSRAGSWSLVLSYVLTWPVVALFLLVGLLLWVHAPPEAGDDTRRVFVDFIVARMPAGLRGLMLAGLFAASMSSLDSALNAMAATTVKDFLRPGAHELRASRIAVGAWAVMLGGFASFCVFWQRASGERLIDFALGVMVFAYSGLLAVFLAALFTRRGNAASAIAALVTGFVTVLAMQRCPLAFGWRMLVATALSFGVCCLGRRQLPPSPFQGEGRGGGVPGGHSVTG